MKNLVELSVLQLYFAGFHAGGRLRYNQSVSASFILTVWRSYGVLNLVKILRGLRLALNIVSRGVLRRVKILFLNLSKNNLFRVSNYNVGEPLATEKWVYGALTNIKKMWRHFFKLYIRKRPWEQAPRLMFYTRMRRLPGAVLVPNYRTGESVLNEATKLFIPTVSLIDINSVPDRTMYGVFTNDQSWVVNFFYTRTLFVQAVLAKVKLVALFGRAKRIFLQRRKTYFLRKKRYNRYY